MEEIFYIKLVKYKKSSSMGDHDWGINIDFTGLSSILFNKKDDII